MVERALFKLLVSLPLMLAALACGSKKEEGPPTSDTVGKPCMAAGDPACGTGAVCFSGACRQACDADASCAGGALCVGSTAPFVCQTPSDKVCSAAVACPAGLVCGLDGTCRTPDTGAGCPRADQLSIAGACVGQSEPSDGAKKMLACADQTGVARCRTSTLPEVCNKTGPGWVESGCAPSTPYCVNGQCTPGAVPAAPSDLVQVPSPLGGTYGIDRTEVSRAQYAKFLVSKGSDTSGQPPYCEWNKSYDPASSVRAAWPPLDTGDHPVSQVDWCDAYAYCKWAQKRLCGKIGGGPGSLDDNN